MTRIIGFVALLALAFAAAAFAGSRIDPSVAEPPGHDDEEEQGEMNGHADTDADSGPGPSTGASLPGLAVAQDGYRLITDQTSLASGRPGDLAFRIVADGGATVTDFDVEHERRMHLIVVRRDFEGFQHLHPEQRDDGSWSVATGAMEPGAYRVFANFSTGGRSLTLGTDLFVPGRFAPQPLPGVSEVADAGDGYEVSIGAAEAVAGATVATEFTVSRNGREVEGVEPYLGADGHLVALRQGDQAFLHTHPEGEAGGPGPIRFQVSYPSAGHYRLYLQFRHRGEVRTAAFTRVVGEAGGTGEQQSDQHEDDAQHEGSGH